MRFPLTSIILVFLLIFSVTFTNYSAHAERTKNTNPTDCTNLSDLTSLTAAQLAAVLDCLRHAASDALKAGGLEGVRNALRVLIDLVSAEHIQRTISENNLQKQISNIQLIPGPPGPAGPPGKDGLNGHNSLTITTVEPSGQNCANGGFKVQTGVDSNDNGILDSSEISTTNYVCNGATGPQGPAGSTGMLMKVVREVTVSGTGGTLSGRATCNSGEMIIGGGANAPTGYLLQSSFLAPQILFPSFVPEGWVAVAQPSTSGGGGTLTIQAICIPRSS